MWRKINRVLQEHGLDVEDLIERTNKETLEEAFPGLCLILERIEREDV